MKKAKSGLRGMIRDFFLPKPYSLYHGIEVNRCEADGQIVTKNSELSWHGGHRIRSPVVLTLKEKVLIWLKIIQ